MHGPHERSSGYDPPEQPHRSVCGPCLHAIDYFPPRTTPRRRAVRQQQQRSETTLPHSDRPAP
ncbi:hypothetical protein [Actinopolyspora xinjiangensis]|uniref:hypothetical protein n=1 Tax=Actinopolyspora xinjiangensis TaxID=405564 RepID=UPI000B844D8B|nr:hypothetical protein [Actinopolyspora xinjiangensis]